MNKQVVSNDGLKIRTDFGVKVGGGGNILREMQ